MPRACPQARRRQRRAAAFIAATVLGGSAAAQSDVVAEHLVGFQAGPVVIAPSLTTGYGYETNVYLLSENAVPPPSSDRVLTLKPAVQVTVPFSNSTFRFKDTLSWVDYDKTPQVAGKTSNEAEAAPALRFGSLDTLELSARHIAGVAETLAFDPGGEVKFQGNAYALHNEGVSISREAPGARGYRFALAHNALRWDRSVPITFYDYKGFDGEGAYVQPLSSNALLAFAYLGTRYDHFPINAESGPPARTEAGDTVYAQIDGRLGPKQPYRVRVGWERLAFEGNDAKDFSGIIGEVNLSAIVGGGTIITVTAIRQPYRSFFGENNFYVFDSVGARIERSFQRGTKVGGDVSYSLNTYDEPDAGILRQDRTVFLEAYANLAVRDQVIFRLSIMKNRKYSNYPGADFDTTAVTGGFVFGWL
jgi:hypothetical protein